MFKFPEDEECPLATFPRVGTLLCTLYLPPLDEIPEWCPVKKTQGYCWRGRMSGGRFRGDPHLQAGRRSKWGKLRLVHLFYLTRGPDLLMQDRPRFFFEEIILQCLRFFDVLEKLQKYLMGTRAGASK